MVESLGGVGLFFDDIGAPQTCVNVKMFKILNPLLAEN